MKSGLRLLLLILCSATAFSEEHVDTICMLSTVSNGQKLTVRGKVDRTMHDMLLVIPNCKEVAVLAYAGEPDDTHHGVSSTSINLPRETPVESSATLTLRKDHGFRVFERHVNAFYKSTRRHRRSEAWKYEVDATFTGRLDVTEKAGLILDEKEHKITGLDGFGHPRPFTRYRFVMEAVADVRTRRLPKAGTHQPGAGFGAL
jgi:hypothetical protein